MKLNISKLSSAVGTSWPTLQKYLQRMDAGSLIHIVRAGEGMRAINKPDKLLFSNPNLFRSLLVGNGDISYSLERVFLYLNLYFIIKYTIMTKVILL